MSPSWAKRTLPSTQSAVVVSAKLESLVQLLRSRTLFIMRPENACAICRSRPTSCSISHESSLSSRAAQTARDLAVGGSPCREELRDQHCRREVLPFGQDDRALNERTSRDRCALGARARRVRARDAGARDRLELSAARRTHADHTARRNGRRVERRLH